MVISQMANKLLVYLVYHAEMAFVEEALTSLLSERDSANFDIIVIDTSTSQQASDFLTNVVPSGIEIIRRQDILTKIVSFVLARYCDAYDYIVRLDADDVFCQGSIAKMLAVMDGDHTIGAVYGGWQLIDTKSNVIAKVEAPQPFALQGFHGACTIMRTAALAGMAFGELEISSQDGFAIYMHLYTSNWQIKSLPYVTFKYRRHTTNLSSNLNRLWQSRLKILRYYMPVPTVDTAILIDCDLANLGDNDRAFIRDRTKLFTISEGVFSDSKTSLPIKEHITLTNFIEAQFEKKAGSVISFNFQKIHDFYFDGLVEYVCLIGDLSQAKHVQFARYIDTPIWHFHNEQMDSVNYQYDQDSEVINKNYFSQVRGVNFFNYADNRKFENFIATNNFFTSNVEFRE